MEGKIMKLSCLDDSNSFKIPIYVLDEIKIPDEKTFSYLIIYTLIYYYAHVDQITKGKTESSIYIKSFNSFLKNFSIQNFDKILQEILKKDSNISNLKFESKKVIYQVNNFNLSSIRVPKSIKSNIERTKRLTKAQYLNYDRSWGLFLIYELLKFFHSLNKNWCLENILSSKNLDDFKGYFPSNLRTNINHYIKYLKDVNFLIMHTPNEYKLNLEITQTYTWPIIPPTYRDVHAYNISKEIASLLSISCFDTIYDVITRLRANLFDLNGNRTGRFLLKLPDRVKFSLTFLELLKNRGRYREHRYFSNNVSLNENLFSKNIFINLEILSNGRSYYRVGKKKFGKDYINPGLSDELRKYFDYRSGCILSEFIIQSSNSFSKKLGSILSSGNRCKIIPHSEGGIKIRFEKRLNDKDIIYFNNNYDVTFDVVNNILEIPPADIFKVISSFSKRPYDTSAEIVRDYRSRGATKRGNGYFFGFLSDYLTFLLDESVQAKVSERMTISFSKFTWISSIYRKYEKEKIKKLIQMLQEVNRGLDLDCYFVVKLIAKNKDKDAILKDCIIKIEFNYDVIEDFDRRFFYSSTGRDIIFNYTLNMPMVSTNKDVIYQEYIGWVLLNKDVIRNGINDFKITVSINNNGDQIDYNDTVDYIQICLDFYINYFDINNIQNFLDYKKTLAEIEDYFKRPFP